MISLAAGLLIIFNAFNVDWFYQGQEAFKYIAIRSFVVKVISLAAIFAFIRSSEDYVRYMLVIVLTTGANYIINMLQLRKFGIRLTCHGIKILPHMKPIFIMLGTTVAIELYTMLDTTMLGLLCDEKNVGYYTNAMKVVKIIITVITAIGGTLLPHLSQYHMEGDDESCGRIVSRVFEIMLFLFLPCCVGLMLTADDLMVVMFGESFAPAGETLRIAALLTLALGFSNLFGTQVLLTFGEEKSFFSVRSLGQCQMSVLIFHDSAVCPEWCGSGIGHQRSTGYCLLCMFFRETHSGKIKKRIFGKNRDRGSFYGGTYMDCHEHGKWRISAACSNSSDRGGLIFCFMHYASQSSLHGV